MAVSRLWQLCLIRSCLNDAPQSGDYGARCLLLRCQLTTSINQPLCAHPACKWTWLRWPWVSSALSLYRLSGWLGPRMLSPDDGPISYRSKRWGRVTTRTRT